MSPPILFLARSWHGAGGMQRLNRDLAREGERAYGERFACVHPSGPGFFSFLGFVLQALVQGARCGRKGGRVHLSDASLLPFGMLLKCLGCDRIGCTVCGRDIVWSPWWYQRLLRGAFSCADRIVCISRATAEEAVRRGADRAKVVVIPPGIHHDTPLSSVLRPPSPLLLSIGRLIPRKGHAWFLEHVLPIIVRGHRDLRFVLVGAGPEEAHIRAIIEARDLRRHVELHVACTDAERDDFFSCADVFLMPNVPVARDMEGFGIVCLEAAVRGIPVVAAHLEGIRDAVIEGETGAFFPPLDAEACAAAVSRLLEHPPSRERIVQSVRERCDWSRVFPLYRQHVFDR